MFWNCLTHDLIADYTVRGEWVTVSSRAQESHGLAGESSLVGLIFFSHLNSKRMTLKWIYMA